MDTVQSSQPKVKQRWPQQIVARIKQIIAIALFWCCAGLSPAIAIPIYGSTLSLPFPVATSTASIEDLRQQQQQIEAERSRIQKEQENLGKLQDAAQDRLDGLNQNIKTTSEKIVFNEQQLEIANQRLSKLQADLAIAEKNYQGKQSATVARLRYLQRQQSSEGWAVLLQSQSLNEFLDRRRQLKQVYESDRNILANLKTQSDDLERRRQNVEQQKNEIALITQELQAQKQEYQAQAITQEDLINRLKADHHALEAAENQLDQDSIKLTNLIQQRIAEQSRNSIVVQGTGQFSYPAGGRITSQFGYRVHPILGYRRFHAGIDFSGSQGSPIRAADSGTVIFAGWYGGYGRAVIINHGGNLTTLYGHASQLYVSEGQTVQRGEAIAAIGATGLATGPHLHFETRVNGSPVNPLNYL